MVSCDPTARVFDGSVKDPGHVGIYIGNGQMIDAQKDGVPVQVHPLQSDYVGAVRYWQRRIIKGDDGPTS